MSDGLWALVCVWCWAMGFVTAWAVSHDNDQNPFWQGWMDVWSMRLLDRLRIEMGLPPWATTTDVFKAALRLAKEAAQKSPR